MLFDLGLIPTSKERAFKASGHFELGWRYRVREVRLLLALLPAVARTNPVVVTLGLVSGCSLFAVQHTWSREKSPQSKECECEKGMWLSGI